MGSKCPFLMEVSPSASSASTTPFVTAPSSPSSHDEAGHDEWHHRFSLAFDHWGDLPVDIVFVPGHDHHNIDCAQDCEFEFDGFPGKVSSASADQLFLEGKIRPLKVVSSNQCLDSAAESEREDGDHVEHNSCPTPSLRVCDILVQDEEDGNYLLEPDKDHHSASDTSTPTTTCSVRYLSSLLPGMSFLKGRHSKSWCFKDFLFRSTSEGRGTSKAAALTKGKSQPEMSNTRRRCAPSAHELHYRTNRMVSDEMKRRTSLPYKHGFFACLGHSGHHISRGSRPGSVRFAVGSS